MERYKVKFSSPETYRRGLELVEGRAPLFVASEKRCFLSVGELPDDVRDGIRELGGDVTVEARFELERVGG